MVTSGEARLVSRERDLVGAELPVHWVDEASGDSDMAAAPLGPLYEQQL